MKNISFFSIVFILSLFAIISCSTTKISSDALETVKDQSPPPGKALVYIVRPGSYGYAVTLNVSCDNKDIGSTTGKRFIYAFLDPGMHKFHVKAENKTEFFLDVKSGKTYFLEQKVKMGLIAARSDLERIEESAGRKKIQSCKLSGDCPAYASVR